MQKVICVSTAKVPIVKIWDPELELACDMNVNNTLALENTRMIKTYVEIDPRVRPLAMIIKHWTKRRIVNDAGKLSSNLVTRLSLTSNSFWGYTEFLYLDMHDHQFPAKSSPTNSSCTTSKTTSEVTVEGRSGECIRRRPRCVTGHHEEQ